MDVPEILETDRLLLRPPELDDADAVFANYASDAEVAKYLTWTPHEDAARTRRSLEAFRALRETGVSFPWMITLKPDDEPLGIIEARVNGSSAELGYVLSPRAWGQGLMTEAVEGIVDWALGDGGLWRVWAVADVDNPGSCRVLEKCGFVREGRLHRWIMHPNISDEARDVWCYAKWRES